MANTTISAGDTIARAPRLAQRMFEEQMLVITVDDSRLHRLNDSATFIWGLLDTPRTVEDLAEQMAGHFDGCTAQQALRDTMLFVNKLVDTGLLVREPPRGRGGRR